MGITLILVGLGCVIGAIVGGGVKLSHLEIAKFSSVSRQAILAAFGLVMMLVGSAIHLGDESTASERTGGGEARTGDVMPKSEQSPDADGQAQKVSSSPRRDISGVWTDVDQNRIVFNLAAGTFTLTPAGTSESYSGKVAAADDRVEWRVDGGGGLCRGVVGSDGRSMSGTCADAQTGDDTPIVLSRVAD